MLLVEQKRSRPVTTESQLVVALEKLDLAGPAFEPVLDGLRTEIAVHMHDEEVGLFPFLRDLEGDVHRWELGDSCVRSCGQHQRTLILIYPSIDRASWSPSQSLD